MQKGSGYLSPISSSKCFKLWNVFMKILMKRQVQVPYHTCWVAAVENKIATEYLQNEPSYNLHRNHRLCGNLYQKPKILFPFHILKADFLTLERFKRHHNNLYKYILLAISVLVALHMSFHCFQREAIKLLEPLNLPLNSIHIEKFK